MRRWYLSAALLCALSAYGRYVFAQDVASKATALRLSRIITGGFMPTSDPLFTQMANRVAAGDMRGAADIAAKSKYFASYLGRRLALQMQSPALDASSGTDNDATAFIIGHFVGAAGAPPSISGLWSDNFTYALDLGGTASVKAAALTPAQRDSLDWAASLVRTPGQTARTSVNNATRIAIPAKHVGGYTTLSDRANDNSYAMYGGTAGTNLRYIEGIWQISTGLSLVDVSSSNALVQDVPKFIPQYDPNFFQGQGQAACISCHGGGVSSLNHGYSAVADIFDYDAANGFIFLPPQSELPAGTNRANNTMKSFGSDPQKRNATATCNLSAATTPVCNPDSAGADPNQGWNVGVTWGPTGVLNTMGWTGPTSGRGLNELGQAIGRAGIVYSFLVKRIVNELCPLASFTPGEVSKIAAAANPFATPKGTDDIRTIVAMVASHPTCL